MMNTANLSQNQQHPTAHHLPHQQQGINGGGVNNQHQVGHGQQSQHQSQQQLMLAHPNNAGLSVAPLSSATMPQFQHQQQQQNMNNTANNMNNSANIGAGNIRQLPPGQGNTPSHLAHQQLLQQQQQQSTTTASLQKLVHTNEQTWLHIGNLAEVLNEHERAVVAFENALRNNPYSVPALTQLASICRSRDQFPKAIEYFQRILNIEGNNGEIWGALGHCYLMMEDLPKAYNSYQQALYHLPNPKEPKLWYGIGILYDRYGSLENAEEAFTSVIKMDPKFEKANEIYFRLGIIYKQQGKFENALQCFRLILAHPPRPLTEIDIWFQIGHLLEFQKDFAQAKDAYENVLKDSPNHAKVLQHLGWLYYQTSTFQNLDTAIQLLSKSIDSDGNDPQSYYLLGRCYMAQGKHNKAYENYQQAVYRDSRNPLSWCSIGVLYFQIGQFRDALDAYTRAIRINPYIAEVWFDLGVLYESCNNQIQDAIDAYTRAAELDQKNAEIASRLMYLKQGSSNTNPMPPPPARDINPYNYRNGFPTQQKVPPPLQNPIARPQQASPFQNNMYGNNQAAGFRPPTVVQYARPPPPTSVSTPQPSQMNHFQHQQAMQQQQQGYSVQPHQTPLQQSGYQHAPQHQHTPVPITMQQPGTPQFPPLPQAATPNMYQQPQQHPGSMMNTRSPVLHAEYPEQATPSQPQYHSTNGDEKSIKRVANSPGDDPNDPKKVKVELEQAIDLTRPSRVLTRSGRSSPQSRTPPNQEMNENLIVAHDKVAKNAGADGVNDEDDDEEYEEDDDRDDDEDYEE